MNHALFNNSMINSLLMTQPTESNQTRSFNMPKKPISSRLIHYSQMNQVSQEEREETQQELNNPSEQHSGIYDENGEVPFSQLQSYMNQATTTSRPKEAPYDTMMPSPYQNEYENEYDGEYPASYKSGEEEWNYRYDHQQEYQEDSVIDGIAVGGVNGYFIREPRMAAADDSDLSLDLDAGIEISYLKFGFGILGI